MHKTSTLIPQRNQFNRSAPPDCMQCKTKFWIACANIEIFHTDDVALQRSVKCLCRACSTCHYNIFLPVICILTAYFSAAQDQNPVLHPPRKNDAVAVVVHLLRHRQGREAALHAPIVRAPVQDRSLTRVPAPDLPKEKVQRRRGLVFVL